MRTPFAVLLLFTLVVTGTYFYRSAEAICAVPIPYRIGTLDDQFGISYDEARIAIADAEAAWEDGTERNLFTYDEGAKLSVNFIFDERQAYADAEENFKGRLNTTHEVSEALRETYEELVIRYRERDISYQKVASEYEARLSQYNETVERYNQEGGAPKKVYAELEAEQKALSNTRRSLNAQAAELNQLVEQINDIGQRGNQLIDTYNRNVNQYNEAFGDAREFTQGDYTGKSINIYTFKSGDELRLVLVHELGHALSLGHTEDSAAIMNHHLGGQTGYQPTSADLTLFGEVCGASTLDRIQQQLMAVIDELQSRLAAITK